jgi:outer membrane protein insertion porin family
MNTLIDVEYRIFPEHQFYTKGFAVSGNTYTNIGTINKQISFTDSTLYNANIITKNRDDLFRLGVFRSIQIFPTFIEGTNLVQPTINIIENHKWTTTMGMGWGYDERFRTQVQVSHHNLLNLADQQYLSVRTSYIEPWNVQFRWIQPAFLSRRLILTVNPFFRRANETKPDYTLDQYGNITSFTHPFLQNLTFNFSHLLEHNTLKEIDIHDEDLGRSLYNQSTVYVQLDADYSFPRRNPFRGFHTISGAGISGLGFGSAYDYYILSQEVRYYQPVSNLFILAARSTFQTMAEIGESPYIPVESRLYLGGMHSVRGWSRNTISPINEAGQYIGGRSSFLLNFEARIPLSDNFSTALLFDSGHVLSDSYKIDVNQLSHSLGLGIRYFTPIGIIRCDFAQALSGSRDNLRFYLTIGESF